jgi:tRNA(Ile)-lysidine synthase
VLRALADAVTRLELAGRRVLVAVSGGVDSVVLLQALHELGREPGAGPTLAVGHVHHGLRGAEADADQACAAGHAERLGLPFAALRVDPAQARAGRPSRDRPTLQEAARALRYRALGELAGKVGAERLATAHTLDDQAETVLLRLLRGTGPDGLAGIPERSPDGRVVRPLLRICRAEIEAFARERRLYWREDATNAELRFARNRLRRRWLPGLAREFNPQLLRAIGNLAEAQRQDSAWIETSVEREQAARFSEEGGWLRIDARGWQALPEPLARRLARAALSRCGSGRLVTRVHLERMGAFLAGARPGTVLELPGGLSLYRDRRGHRLGPLPARPRHAC